MKPENEISSLKKNSNKKKAFNIDFGQVCQGDKKQKFIYLINSNEMPIKINDIILNNNSNMNFLLDIESYEYFGNNAPYQNMSYLSKGDLLQQLKERNKDNNHSISFWIYPNDAVKLSINL